MKIVWTVEGRNTLNEIFEHILEDDPYAAKSVRDRIFKSMLRLSEFPYSARTGRVAETRELVVPDLPYIVVYSIFKQKINILSVRHTSQEWPESFDKEKPQ